ncbi:MarR family winged helix-turn-helix transcriptional regulator [Tenggerimyces flavus]|uniref:MarR family winged helix-turn-helix transcriptional regulator n=1 Tax=Tenggerimyces flavus TaxID=1708749 RepID=A0ABV7Y6Z5_9ACTN|nr:MarR family winged helix-turn-helix transcriptional regulator [Tenggerimyces flavus]MBM7785318.1 DNA-binding MarR family transcriptional regulator [Tenggerimyces flavus]
MSNNTSQSSDTVPSALVTVEYVMFAAHYLRTTLNAQLAEARTSVPRTRLLTALRGDEPRRMGDVAAMLGVTGRTLTVLTDALEQEGLLTRLADPNDRRATLLALTGAGREQLTCSHQVRMDQSERAVENLTEKERQTLVRLVGKLTGGRTPDCC